MRSGNWFFSVPLFRKNVSRFWPLWGLYTLILGLMLPVFFLTNRPTWHIEPLSTIFHNYIMELAVNPFLIFFFAIGVALALWSCLYNSKSVSLLHALPLRRETIFFTNYVTGLIFFLAPTLMVLLLSLGVQAVLGAVVFKTLLVWLLCQGLMMVFFFSFATLLAFVTGHILTLPALYFIFSGLFYGLRALLNTTFRQFVYGYAGSPVLEWIGEHFTPLVKIMSHVRLDSQANDHVFYNLTGQNWLYLYGGIGILLAALALLLYRRRKLETAGEVISVSWMRPVFKYGVALCGALTFGNLFYSMFAYSGGLPEGLGTMLLFLLLWGAICYFAADMLLKKSFRVFRQGWKGCGVLLVVILAAMLAMDWDVFGIERKVPDPGQVESVIIQGPYRWNLSEEMPFDEDLIAAVTAFHQIAAGGKRDVAYWNKQQDENWQGQQEEFTWGWIDIRYQMKDGGSLHRQYSIPISRSLLEQEGSMAQAYEALLNGQDWRVEANLPAQFGRDLIFQARIDRTARIPYETGAASDALWNDNESYLSQEIAQRLYDAVREDLQAGRIGTQYLLWEDEQEFCYSNNLIFYFRYVTDGKPAYVDLYIDLQTTASATLALLEELGFRKGVDLLTWEEVEALEAKRSDGEAYDSREAEAVSDGETEVWIPTTATAG